MAALRIPPAAAAAAGVGGASKRQSPPNFRCSIENRRRNAAPADRSSYSSAVHPAEERAGWHEFEKAAADLERLFRRSGPLRGGGGTGADGGKNPLRVAYQGARGSYCQEAAAAAFPSSSCCPCGHMEAAFAALENGDVERAVVPLENSLDGTVPRNFDLLLRHPDVCVAGEVLLPVNHCLLSHPDAPPSSLRRVVSHPQALSHCAPRLRSLGLRVEEVPCAADAARLIAEDAIADTAVIGSRMAAREFGLKVLEANLQGPAASSHNVTRFLQLALGAAGSVVRPPPTSARMTKTTVAVWLRRGPSELFQAMCAVESGGGAKVTRVDHRPNRARPLRTDEENNMVYMDYVFILDVEGEPTPLEAAVARIGEVAESVRVLGSYASADAA